MSNLRNNFIFLRNKKGLKQYQISVSLGFSSSAWNNYETGKSTPNISDLQKISDFFGVTMGDLLDKDLSTGDLNSNFAPNKNTKKSDLNSDLIGNLNAKKGYNLENTDTTLVVEEPHFEYNKTVEPKPTEMAYLGFKLAVIEEKVNELTQLVRELTANGSK
jgi:transcriptional regulator with XRE-family HTH domain